ncbi:MAG TPA: chromate resistance protein ChrB domain-containing protein [Alphaproteobacteria bacterium]|nr:chromate resistance protein ChrB domain-containing protein [Alphaproteobacteria bacterium]
MSWVAFSYSLPSKAGSSVRVTVWRRLRRLGAIAPTNGMHVLPDRDECLEAFQWLAQEVQQAKGEALVLHVERFEGMPDAQLIDLFRQTCAREYAKVEAKAAALERRIGGRRPPRDQMRLRTLLERLRRQQADIARVDYFDAPEGSALAARLARLEEALSPLAPSGPDLTPATAEAYRGRRWVTRPRPHVDRLACIWLIRRFIDPGAVIRYAPTAEPDEVAFDMRDGEFGHRGHFCTFETMLAVFGLQDSSLRAIAEIVHEIDLRDARYTRPETAGVDAILKGWLLAGFTDAELESHGVALFEGLYAGLSRVQRTPTSRRKR